MVVSHLSLIWEWKRTTTGGKTKEEETKQGICSVFLIHI